MEVTEPARYMIRYIVRELAQRPVDMAFGVNGERIHQVSIAEYGNLGTATVELIVPLQPPAATIDVWYLNDCGDAVITQIEIARHSLW